MTKLIDEMCELTKQGIARAERAAQERVKKAQQEQNEIVKRAKKSARDSLAKALENVRAAAAAGHSSCGFGIGEVGDRSFGDFVWIEASTLKDLLIKKGFDVRIESQTHEPFGSDPYRYDTYTDVSLL